MFKYFAKFGLILRKFYLYQDLDTLLQLLLMSSMFNNLYTTLFAPGGNFLNLEISDYQRANPGLCASNRSLVDEIRAGKICNSAIATFRIVQISFLQIDFSSSVHVIFLSIFHVKKQGKLRSAKGLPIFYAIDCQN